MSSPYVAGVNSPEQARICIYSCDFPDRDCVINGNVYPHRRRCALERYVDDNYEAPPEIPSNYLTVNEVASRIGVTYETIRTRCRDGKYPGAKRAGNTRTAPWIIPAELFEVI